ncbi:MAG: hypothetical protein AAF215_21170 [Cyanobacteria bacterium P01_A01_bin.123]
MISPTEQMDELAYVEEVSMVSPTEQLDGLAHVEQEFEDLQGLIKQHFSSVEELTKIQAQLRALDQLQTMVQTDNHKMTEALEQFKQGQAALNDRVDALETHLEQFSDNFSQMRQAFEQSLLRLGHLSSSNRGVSKQLKKLSRRLYATIAVVGLGIILGLVYFFS